MNLDVLNVNIVEVDLEILCDFFFSSLIWIEGHTNSDQYLCLLFIRFEGTLLKDDASEVLFWIMIDHSLRPHYFFSSYP